MNDRRVVAGDRQRFTSELLPPDLRRSQAISELLPALYLRGLSTGDFMEGLAALLGENAAGFSPSVVTRLVSSWQEEYTAWKTRSVADRDYVYVWADGVHFNVRLDDERLAALVIIGARPNNTKEVIALEDGDRESTESWAALLRDLKARGMRAPVAAVGAGALGFWAVLREVFLETRAVADGRAAAAGEAHPAAGRHVQALAPPGALRALRPARVRAAPHVRAGAPEGPQLRRARRRRRPGAHLQLGAGAPRTAHELTVGPLASAAERALGAAFPKVERRPGRTLWRLPWNGRITGR